MQVSRCLSQEVIPDLAGITSFITNVDTHLIICTYLYHCKSLWEWDHQLNILEHVAIIFNLLSHQVSKSNFSSNTFIDYYMIKIK